ncbi:MAG: hypothetical protein HUU21_37825 [Polyangiaceae bacterium]|nr:hypothetical protein [Polyangiaceae bacterium]
MFTQSCRRRISKRYGIAFTVISLAAPMAAHASDDPAAAQVELSIDLWAFSVTTDNIVNGQPASSYVPFSTAAKNLNSGVFGQLIVHKGSWVFLVDITRVDLDLSGSDVPPEVEKTTIRNMWSTAGIGYAVQREASAGDHPLKVVVMPGVFAAYTSLDLGVTGRSNGLAAKVERDWLTPAPGGIVTLTSGKWGLRIQGYADISGRSRSARQWAIALEYSPPSTKFADPTFGFGYRYRYDEKVFGPDLKLNTELKGPGIYATFRF